MPKLRHWKKKTQPKKMTAESRKRDALRWFRSKRLPGDIVDAYAHRYGIPESEAHIELLELGYSDMIQIQYYEREGIEWEYRYDGYYGEMLVASVIAECDAKDVGIFWPFTYNLLEDIGNTWFLERGLVRPVVY
jgi:hypothetical protein